MLATVGMVAFLAIPWFVKLVLLVGTLGYGWQLVRQARLILPASILRLQCDDKIWRLMLKNQEVIGELRGDSIVTPWLIMLRFQFGEKLLSCLIFRDTLGQESFRQLLVLLRLRFTG